MIAILYFKGRIGEIKFENYFLFFEIFKSLFFKKSIDKYTYALTIDDCIL